MIIHCARCKLEGHPWEWVKDLGGYLCYDCALKYTEWKTGYSAMPTSENDEADTLPKTIW